MTNCYSFYLAIFLLFSLVWITREGFETKVAETKVAETKGTVDYLSDAIQSIQLVQKDSRLTKLQKDALENAIYYAKDIQRM